MSPDPWPVGSARVARVVNQAGRSVLKLLQRVYHFSSSAAINKTHISLAAYQRHQLERRGAGEVTAYLVSASSSKVLLCYSRCV